MQYQIVVTGIFLLICTYTDLRYRCIYRKIVYGLVILSVSGHLVCWITGLQESPESAELAGAAASAAHLAESVVPVAAGLIPGVVCFLISLLTREAFGYGDSMAVAACGVSLGLENTAGILTAGFLFSAVWAVFLCVFRKADLKKEFPFLPFLTAAFVLQIFTGGFA